ncbi:ty3-gypsy retrotransposon protein, partial [Tanacetum coccineum]
MVSDRPQQWVRLLPWAEYCYNTSYHSSINMSPYQALYGRLTLSLIPYPPRASKVAVVDKLLMEQNEVTRQLKQNLLAAKLRMKKANRKCRDVEFKVGDKVFVKLQPYLFKEGQLMEQPVGVCDSRMVLQNGKYKRQVLVQWAGRSPEEETWEWLTDFQSA